MNKVNALEAALLDAKEEDRIACESGTACSEALHVFAEQAVELVPKLFKAVELLRENLTAWDGEEDSVKEEHADLIADTRNFIESLT